MVNRLHKVTRPAARQKPVPVKIVADKTSSAPCAISDMKWKAQAALDTLARAEEIRKDRPLMRAVQAEARAKMKQLSTVCKKK